MSSTQHRRPSFNLNTKMELELYKRMHADWLLSPFAIFTNIFRVNIKSKKLVFHKNWRLETGKSNGVTDVPKTIPFGKGIAGQAVLKGRTVYKSNLEQIKLRNEDEFLFSNTASSLAIPIKGKKNEILAVLKVDSPYVRAFGDPYVRKLFKGYAKQIAHLISQTEPHELDRVLTDLEVQIEMAFLLEQYLMPIYRAIRRLNKDHRILVFLADVERKELTLFQTGNFNNIDNFVSYVPFGEGVTGRAAMSLKSVYESDTEKTFGKNYIELSKGTRSNFAIPIRVGPRLLGVINVENPKPNAFPEKQRELINNYCVLAADAMQSAQRLHLEMQERHFIQALRELTSTLVIQPNRRDVCDLVVRKAVELTGAAFGSVQIYEKKTDNLIMMSVWPPNQRDPILERYGVIKKGQGITGQAAKKLQPVWITNIPHMKKKSQYLASLNDIYTELAVPLFSKHGQLAGVLNVEWNSSTRPQKIQAVRELEALADIAVIGLSSAQMSESVEDRVQLGRNKIAVMIQLAYSVLHDSLPKIILSRLSLYDAQRYIDRAGRMIEKDIPDLSSPKGIETKQKILDQLIESDLSIKEVLELLADFRREWDEFKHKTQGLSDKGYENGGRITLQSAIDNAIQSALKNKTLKETINVEIELNNLLDATMNPSISIILSQLISNAGDFMAEVGTLRVSANRWEHDPTLVEICISDNGGGIPAEIQEKIFEPFYSGRKNRRAGQGLGLYLARATAEAIGGRLDLKDSYFKDGTTFALRLPLGVGE